MKKLISILLCLMLLFTLMLPVAATESSTGTTGTVPSSSTSEMDARDEAYGNPSNANTMAVICVVIIVLGGAYLLFGFKRAKDV